MAAAKTEGGKKEATIKPASVYEEIATSFEARAVEHESHAADNVTLITRFGALLSEKKVGKLDAKSDIVWEWDKNGDGKLSQSEFRLQMKGLGLSDDVKEIDSLFKDWDKDSSGFLELTELKVAFKYALVKAAEVAGGSKEIRERAERLRHIAAQAKEVVERTAELETEEATLQSMKDSKGKTLEEKLGQVLAKRNTHIGDLTQGWDSSGDGIVDKAEFKQHVKSIVAEIDEQALEELYEQVDGDHNGKLDVSELKETLKRLQIAASRSVADVADEVSLVTEMQRIVKKMQLKMDKTVADDKKMEEEAAAVELQ